MGIPLHIQIWRNKLHRRSSKSCSSSTRTTKTGCNRSPLRSVTLNLKPKNTSSSHLFLLILFSLLHCSKTLRSRDPGRGGKPTSKVSWCCYLLHIWQARTSPLLTGRGEN